VPGHDQSSADDPARFRERRLKYAIGTSLGSKISTAVVQILAFPIAIRALGDAQFVLYAMLGSAIGWIGLVNVGVGPPLTVRMSDAQAAGDRVRQQQLLSSAFFPVLLLVLATGGALALASRFVEPAALFGARYAADRQTIMSGLWLLAIILLSQTLLSVVEAAQLGHQEQHHFNAMAIGGNLASAVAIVLVAILGPSVVGMVAAVGVPPVCFRIANAVRFMRGRPYLRPTPGAVSWTLCRALLTTGLVFSLASGVGNFLCHQLPIVLVGRWRPLAEASSLAVALNALVLAAGMVASVAMPLWPAISDGMARGDRAWVARAYRRILAYAVGYGALGGVVFAILGSRLFTLWYGPSVDVSPALCAALGLYFFLLMWENAHFAVLIGVNRIGLPSVLYLGRSVAAIALMSMLVTPIGPPATFIALAASVCVFTLLPFRVIVGRALAGVQGTRF
jgi:O-antigen/teichoic acid export membrane protein